MCWKAQTPGGLKGQVVSRNLQVVLPEPPEFPASPSARSTQRPGAFSTSFIYNLDLAVFLLISCQGLSLQAPDDVLTLSPVCVSELLLWLSPSPPPTARHLPPPRTVTHTSYGYTPSGSHTSLSCVATFAYAALSARNVFPQQAILQSQLSSHRLRALADCPL